MIPFLNTDAILALSQSGGRVPLVIDCMVGMTYYPDKSEHILTFTYFFLIMDDVQLSDVGLVNDLYLFFFLLQRTTLGLSFLGIAMFLIMNVRYFCMYVSYAIVIVIDTLSQF